MEKLKNLFNYSDISMKMSNLNSGNQSLIDIIGSFGDIASMLYDVSGKIALTGPAMLYSYLLKDGDLNFCKFLRDPLGTFVSDYKNGKIF